MKTVLRKTYLYIVACIVMLATQGCTISYKFNGTAINYDIYRTIDVGEFPIRAALVYPPLQQTFENELLDAISRPLWRRKALSAARRYRIFPQRKSAGRCI